MKELSIQQQAEMLAHYMYFVGTKKTHYGNWIFYLKECCDKLGLSYSMMSHPDNYEIIEETLLYHPGVCDIELYEDEETKDVVFDINFFGYYMGGFEDDVDDEDEE